MQTQGNEHIKDDGRKTVALITGSVSTKAELCRQLKMLLDGYIKVKGYAIDEGISSVIKADLIVLSSALLVDDVQGLIDPVCPVIIANRSLNFEHLEELFRIPRNAEVILANDEQATTEDFLRLLQEIGIDYLRFVPYWPGLDYEGNAKIAIVAGESNVVPDSVEEIINMGPRVIDITTVIEILSIFGRLDANSRLITSRYVETIIRLNKRLSDMAAETDSANSYLKKVLNQVNDGIIAFSREGTVTVFNEKSEQIFGVSGVLAVNNHLNQIIKNRTVCDFLLTSGDMEEQVFQVNGLDVVISKFSIDKLNSSVCTVRNAKETLDLEKKVRRQLAKKGYIGKYTFQDIAGSSESMRATISTARRLAGTDLNLLIYGESGVGKELFASAIHNESARRSGPFLAVNFSALSEELVESELFGYEEGSFTGAKKGGSVGLFEQANGGTIFLDEIGDVSLRIQARLLRVLQEKEIRHVGGEENIPVNVRVVAATNRDLKEMCRSGLFREDLYHRLKKLYLVVPPLRERLSDLDDLVHTFLKKNGRDGVCLSPDVWEALRRSPWTGNVRELENTIDYMLAVSDGQSITAAHIPQDFFDNHSDSPVQSAPFPSQPTAPPNLYGINLTDIDERLCLRGSQEEYLSILGALAEISAGGSHATRDNVAALLLHRGRRLSVDQVRRRCDVLQQEGLLVKSRGRGGMHLTLKGKEYVSTRKAP